ncbi:MAG: PAS domain S-box protein, partial [Anaerolineales bacterium]|nr:PAS domain S-box protein [Anaerolineales bacterium]
RHAPGVPIVILTGLQDEALARKAASSGAQDYVVKGELTGFLLQRTLNYAIERQQLLREQQKLNRALAVLSDVNQAVVRAQSEQALLEEVCAILANRGGYCLTWVGYALQDAQKQVRPMAWAGSKLAYLNTVDVVWADTPRGRGPTGTAVRTARPAIVRDTQTDPSFAPWRKAAAGHGIRAMIALPLLKDGQAFGALAIYSAETAAFDAAEVNLLVELAKDLAFGIDTLRTTVALRQSEEKFGRAFHNSPVAMMIASMVDNHIIDLNESGCRLFGFDRAALVGQPADALHIWAEQPDPAQVRGSLARGQEVHDLEMQVRSSSGDVRHVLASFSPIDLHDEPCVLSLLHDITARKEAEAAQRQAQQLAQATIDALTAHIAVLDETGAIIGVNQSWQNFARANGGDPRRVGVGANYLAVCDAAVGKEAAQARQMAAAIRAVMTGAQDEVTLEYPCHAAREQRWFVARIMPMAGTDPAQRRVVVAHENITSRRQAEAALRRSEQLYRRLFDGNPLPMWVCDLETLAFLEVNQAAVSQYGYSQSTFRTMTLGQLQAAADAPPGQAGDGRGTLPSRRAAEQRHRLQDGRIIDVELTRDTITFDGRPAALITAVDVTERNRAAAERSAQAQRLRQILDAVPEGVLLLDAGYRILSLNPMAANLLPALADAAVDEVLAELGGQPIGRLLAAAAGRAAWQEVRTPDGERLFELSAQPLAVNGAPAGWVVALRDVTEERARQQYAETQQRLATVGQLAAGIAHDFNNIMAVITLYSDVLQNQPDHKRRSYYLQTIKEQAVHAANLIGQILDFSRRSVLTRGELDLRPFIKEFAKLLRRTLPETIEIQFVETAGPCHVHADPTHLQQVLMNLAVNARDAMPDGGTLRLALEPLALAAGERPPLPDMAPGDWVCLHVSDTGSGIPADVMPHLFEPFFTTKRPGQGTGLGLAQVYGIVKQHNGEIGVVSSVGRGSTFTVYLPAMGMAAETAVDSGAARPINGRGQLILLVEDNDVARDAIAEVLEKLNYRVLQAANGAEGLRLFEARMADIALVVTDMVMPKMGGVQLHAQLQALDPAVKVIVITGYPLEEDSQALLSQGIVAWIQKPFSLHRLAAEIDGILS